MRQTLVQLLKPCVSGILIEIGGLIGFITFSQTNAHAWKYLPLCVALLLLSAVFFSMARTSTVRDLTVVAAIVGVAVTLMLQLLGLFIWPGLLKGLQPLSMDHLENAARLVALLFVAHIVYLLGLRGVAGFLKAR